LKKRKKEKKKERKKREKQPGGFFPRQNALLDVLSWDFPSCLVQLKVPQFPLIYVFTFFQILDF
jgi:hypothetical protein